LVAFQTRSYFRLGPVSDCNPPTDACCVAGITGVCHQVKLVLLRWDLANVLPRLVFEQLSS
jgi:hypothetical protein